MMTARGEKKSDAVARTVEIVPDGLTKTCPPFFRFKAFLHRSKNSKLKPD